MANAKVTVLGAGSWGSALAALASPRANTMIWARNQELAQTIQNKHINPKYLPTINLPKNLSATSDFAAALQHVINNDQGVANKNLLILGIPMSGLEEIAQKIAANLPTNTNNDLHILWTCKGIHPESYKWPHEIIEQYLPQYPWLHTGVISGPSFAKEVASGLPVALTVASKSQPTAQISQEILHGDNARIYSSNDVIGVEVGGAMKNVIAIACGINDGLGLGANSRAALITRGLAELRRLGTALGGLAETFMGLTGLGDLVLTATGDLSRNRQVGLALAQGQSLEQILAGGMTAEGARCAKAALSIGQHHQLDLPIIAAVCQVLDGTSPKKAVSYLLEREPKPE